MAESNGSYDIVILGGGSGGYACALRAAELGKRVALIEKDKVGGTCLHRGCIPTKALLHAAEIADQARDGEAFGVRSTFEGIDMAGVNAYKDKVVDRLWKGLQSTLASRQDRHRLRRRRGWSRRPRSGWATRVYRGQRTSCWPPAPSRAACPAWRSTGERVITSDHALRLDRVPRSAVILGGGVIGVEFASVWRSFGAEVTIVEMLPHLLPPEDESSSKLLERAFRRRGIGTSSAPASRASRSTGTGVTVTLDGRQDDRRRAAAGRGGPRAGLGRARLRGGRGRHRARLRAGGRVLPDQRADDLGGR